MIICRYFPKLIVKKILYCKIFFEPDSPSEQPLDTNLFYKFHVT